MSENKIRLTVGLPTYNSQKFLENTLNVILAQTFKDFTLIINDDGSTDRTDEICRAYAAKDKRIRYSRSEKNLGGAINYQRVFHLADTEFFRWAAHDDSMAPQLLERCIEILDQHTDVVMCYPRAMNIDENGNVLGQYDDNFNFQSAKPHERFNGVLKGMWGHAGNPMFGVVRRELMSKTALIAPFPASDMTFIAELSLYGKFYEIPDRLYFHRIHSGMSNKLGLTSSEYTAWHDKSKAGKLSFPKILRLKALIEGINKSPIPAFEKLRCHFHVFRYYVSLKNIPKLFYQLRYNIVIRFGRLFKRINLK